MAKAKITEKAIATEAKNWKRRVAAVKNPLKNELKSSASKKFVNREIKPPKTVGKFKTTKAGKAVITALGS